VLAQSPASGKAPQGSTVTLTIAQAPPNVTVPNLVGATAYAASARLGKLGLTPSVTMVVKNVNRDYNGLVLSESPQRGTSVVPGTTVTLFVEEYVPAAPTGPTGPTGASGTGTT
jgi:beta-lactam-binding protein with PASTA domain